MKKMPIYTEWVQTLMDYNNELIAIIDEIQSNGDIKLTHDNNNCISIPLPTSSSLLTKAVDKHNLIDLNDCQFDELAQSTKSMPSTAVMISDEIISLNVCTFPCLNIFFFHVLSSETNQFNI